MKIEPSESDEHTLVEFEADNDRSAMIRMRREALGRCAELWHEEALIVRIARHASRRSRHAPTPDNRDVRAQLPGWAYGKPGQEEEQRPHGWGWRKTGGVERQ